MRKPWQCVPHGYVTGAAKKNRRRHVTVAVVKLNRKEQVLLNLLAPPFYIKVGGQAFQEAVGSGVVGNLVPQHGPE